MRFRHVLLVSASTLLTIAGCGHEVDGPGPAAAPPVTPDVLCVEQHPTKVTLNGGNFIPMPINTLDGTPQLLLPAVTLDQVQGLDGAVARSQVKIPDDPSTPAASRVRWTSTQQMTVEVTPELGLAPGLYDVVVTNPGGGKSTSFPGALAAVPRPSVSKVGPDILCDAQADQTVTITGGNLLKVGGQLPVARIGTREVTATKVEGCKDVPGVHTEGSVQLCASATYVLPKGALEAGSYDITLTDPAPVGCASTDKLSVVVVPPPVIVALVPPAICDDQANQTVTINGTGFLKVGGALPKVVVGAQTFVPTAAGGCVAVPGTFAEGVVETCTSLTLTVPKKTFSAGDYPVRITNPPPADCATTQMISLHDDDPPTVSAVAPSTVCSGGGKTTITGTNFHAGPPGPTVSLQAPGQATVNSASVATSADGKTITAQIPGGALPGTTYDVVVTNADGCSDEPPHKTVNVVPGPIVYLADPEVAYNGVSLRVTLYLTGITPPLAANAVSMTPAGMATPVTTLPWNPVAGHPNRIEVVIPKGQAPGLYDITVADASGCSAFLAKAVNVDQALTVTIKNILPPFGWTDQDTPITIVRDTAAPAPRDKPFLATPRAFLNPAGAAPTVVAVPLVSVALVDANTVTAVVPKGTPAGTYDLVVTNPDGTVGFLANAFRETASANPPPTITSVTPSSIVSTANQIVTVTGANFRASTNALTCKDGGGVTSTLAVTSAAPVCVAGVCTQTVTIDGSTLSGKICVLRLTNSDGTYVDYSAIGVTNSSLNLQKPTKAGSLMNTARRALVTSAVDTTGTTRFVYAIGGDGGSAAAGAPFNDGELATVDFFGAMGPWSALRYATGGARSFAASATVGRYIYVAGGSDGTNSLQSAARAMALNPREAPGLDVDDLALAATGLDAGYWFYKVSATFSASDPDNPNGESLPSDEFIVKLPSFPGKKLQVILKWSPPADSLGTPLPNVTGYRVYRTAVVNGVSSNEVLLATTAATTYTDDGTGVPGTARPLPTGSLGQWATLPSMATRRKGAAGAAAFDPTDPAKVYFYALLGVSGGTTAVASYEYLPVTITANGHQTVGTWTAGASSAAQARWQAGAWVATSATSTTITAPDTYVFIGGGLTGAGAAANNVNVGKVSAGGDLGAFAASQNFSSNAAGYGVCAANNQLFVFGGANGAPSNGARSASFQGAAPGLANNSWNSEGLTMLQSRYLMGSAVQSAFIFLVGGDTGGGAASKTTELVVW